MILPAFFVYGLSFFPMCLDMHQPMAKPAAAAHKHMNALNNTFSVLNMFPSLLHEPAARIPFPAVRRKREPSEVATPGTDSRETA
jgi:hypothetical protein